MNELTIRITFQILTLLVIFFTIVIQIQMVRLSKIQLGNVIALSALLVHAIVFYGLVILSHFGISPLGYISFTDWSSRLRFHTFITIAFLEYGNYRLAKLSKEFYLGGKK